MAKQFDFYFDFGSLASYLAHTQLPKICAATGATAMLMPMLLGGQSGYVHQYAGLIAPGDGGFGGKRDGFGRVLCR